MKYAEKKKILESYELKKNYKLFLENAIIGIKSPAFNETSSTIAHKTKEDLMDELYQVDLEMQNIVKAIEKIENSWSKITIQMKYIHGMKVILIANSLGCSLTTAQRYHKMGIELIDLEKKDKLDT